MEEPGPQPDPSRDATPLHRMPAWVRGFVIVGIVLVVVFVLASAIGGGDHGPSRHLPGGEGGEVEPRQGDEDGRRGEDP